MKFIIFILALISTSPFVWAAEDIKANTPANGKTKFKAAKDLNFEELIIEGQNKRPELSVVTGDEDQFGNGLLRLRENFVDRMIADDGEEIP